MGIFVCVSMCVLRNTVMPSPYCVCVCVCVHSACSTDRWMRGVRELRGRTGSECVLNKNNCKSQGTKSLTVARAAAEENAERSRANKSKGKVMESGIALHAENKNMGGREISERVPWR